MEPSKIDVQRRYSPILYAPSQPIPIILHTYTHAYAYIQVCRANTHLWMSRFDYAVFQNTHCSRMRRFRTRAAATNAAGRKLVSLAKTLAESWPSLLHLVPVTSRQMSMHVPRYMVHEPGLDAEDTK